MSGLGYSKKETEEDVKRRFITPAIEKKWDTHTQILMERYFTDGRVHVSKGGPKRGEGKKADYLLCYRPEVTLAVVEAKDMAHSLGDGMQQAVEYAKMNDIPFAYSSNGTAFLEHDRLKCTEREIALDDFPGPEELWARYTATKQLTEQQAKALLTPYHPGGKTPRYYQQVAINRTIEAIAKGQHRILLVMATGTGKTFTASQIVYILKSAGLKKKILYLADRNVLIDQPMNGDFKPFAKVSNKITGKQIDPAYEVYFALYQQLTGEVNMEPFRAVERTFFDLVIVDECHRGSAADDSLWRTILDYFSGATQIGMTATPKETKDASNSDYFGEPIYTYSLRQGIEDGFLAPFRVRSIDLDKDSGWRPQPGQRDYYGREIEDREYSQADYDRNMVMTQRTQLVAKEISQHLRIAGRMDKTIVFCTDIDHAERMRQALVNENSDMVAKNSNYVMRITGGDDVGVAQLDNFMAEDSPCPVIATTSELLTTGVDTKLCKLIVLDRTINSMTKFKQIIGRGTRLNQEKGKMFFTIMDFKGACRLFADPGFDGDPIPDDDEEGPNGDVDGGRNPRPQPLGGEKTSPLDQKYRVDDVQFNIVCERILDYGEDGRLLTGDFIDHTRANILGRFATLDSFIQAWRAGENKQAIVEELEALGAPISEIRADVGGRIGEIDDFDLICHIAFDKVPLTKAQRAANVKKRDYLSKYEGVAREVLSALLDKYAQNGISDLENSDVLTISPLRDIAPPGAIMDAFGGRDGFLKALDELKGLIYDAA